MLKTKIRKTKAAVKIQCLIRRFIAKMKLLTAQEKWRHINKASVIITSLFRIIHAKIIVANLRVLCSLASINRSAVTIQNKWRIFLAQRIRNILVRAKEMYRAGRKRAAIRIQCMARMVAAKTLVYRIKLMWRARGDIQGRKSIIIQKWYRGHSGRVICNAKRFLITQQYDREFSSASVIQHALRRHWLRSAVDSAIMMRRKRVEAAVVIQAIVRGLLVRLLVQGTKHYDFVTCYLVVCIVLRYCKVFHITCVM